MANAHLVVVVIVDSPVLSNGLIHVLLLLLKGASELHVRRDILSVVRASQPDSSR